VARGVDVIFLALVIAATLRLLDRGEQLAGLTLGTQSDLVGAPPYPERLVIVLTGSAS
jgi:hypothetical protein